MAIGIERFDVCLATLDPTIGAEMRKTRPCLVISPDAMNRNIRTVIIAPMTTKGRPYPTRVACQFEGTTGQVVLDQLRAVDKSRLIKRLGKIEEAAQAAVLAMLAEIFAA